MTVRAFLDDIAIRMPNAFDEDRIVCWLNHALCEVYKILGLREGFSFRTVKGQILYPLPREITFDLICAVVVGQKEYTPRRIGDTAFSDIWFKAAEGFLGIYPPPSGEKATVWYFMRPPLLLTRAEAEEAGTDFDTQRIWLDPDYAEMLRTAVLITIAEAREDITLANNYKLSYNMLLTRARQERYEKDGKYPVTKDVRGRTG